MNQYNCVYVTSSLLVFFISYLFLCLFTFISFSNTLFFPFLALQSMFVSHSFLIFFSRTPAISFPSSHTLPGSLFHTHLFFFFLLNVIFHSPSHVHFSFHCLILRTSYFPKHTCLIFHSHIPRRNLALTQLLLLMLSP